MTEIVPGIFSNIGRVTDKELSRLRPFVQIDEKKDAHQDDDDVPAKVASPKKSHGGKIARSGKKPRPGAPPPEDLEAQAAATPIGDLARLVRERLREKKVSAQSPPAEKTSPAPRGAPVPPPTQKPTVHFGGRPNAEDVPWSSKFTAQESKGALNRWNEQRPDLAWYKVTYGMVHNRVPSWDFSEKPRTRSIKAVSEGNADAGHMGSGDACFLTGVDTHDDASLSSGSSPKAAQRRPRSGPRLRHEPMALAAPRPELAKVGRKTIQYHEVSAPADDLLVQDVKGYHKHRYAHWDFAKLCPRPNQASDEKGDPGKYEASLSQVAPRTKSAASFDRSMPRDVPPTTLGKLAPAARLHPDEKRAPGACVQDRSRSKDCIRTRVTNVNNFDLELARPPLGKTAEESASDFALAYNPDRADLAVTSRRDVGPTYKQMLPRGRDAVQGIRALGTDLGVRGAVGLDGFVETSGLRDEPQERLEGRKANARWKKPDVGPQFNHYTSFEPTLMHNNYVHGAPKVFGEGQSYQRKLCGLRGDGKSKSLTSFQRESLGPGFTHARGSVRSRTFEALPDWSDSIRGVV